MKRRINWKLLAGLLAGALVLGLIQALLIPKYMTSIPEGALIGEYYDNAGGNDVVFIGDCEVYENFSPITLWEEYGITSYIRGSAQQLIWQSYYLMEETFQYETPKVMVFNVLSMKYDTPQSTGASATREAYNRMTLDGMRWSTSKWNSILASMTQEEQEKEGLWSYLFPLLRYHDRWSDLTAEDFTYWFGREEVSDNGYLMQVKVNPAGAAHMEPPRIHYEFSDICYDYLEKMRLLCEEHGTQLVLIKAPSLSPVWWDQWDQQIESYARQHDLLYINFLDYQQEIGLDWNTDTYDTGLHLNVYGAEKLSRYFGQILVEKYALDDHRVEEQTAQLWAEKAQRYHSRKELLEQAYAAELQNEQGE